MKGNLENLVWIEPRNYFSNQNIWRHPNWVHLFLGYGNIHVLYKMNRCISIIFWYTLGKCHLISSRKCGSGIYITSLTHTHIHIFLDLLNSVRSSKNKFLAISMWNVCVCVPSLINDFLCHFEIAAQSLACHSNQKEKKQEFLVVHSLIKGCDGWYAEFPKWFETMLIY